MGTTTAIAWTDHTFNPWWGCERVSAGCKNCYAEAFANRVGEDVWGKGGERRRFGEKHWAEPLKWDRAAEAAGRPSLVFCASMADVFEDRRDHLDDRARLFDLMDRTPHLIWQLLTKRPENVLGMVPLTWRWPMRHESPIAGRMPEWPSNVWIGTTVEDQAAAEERLPVLLEIPAAIRFLSCEPLIGRVDIPGDRWRLLQWVIAGGESGNNHRPLDVDHARNLRDQAAQYGVPFFFKQHGGRYPHSGGDELDGRTIKNFPLEAQR